MILIHGVSAFAGGHDLSVFVAVMFWFLITICSLHVTCYAIIIVNLVPFSFLLGSYQNIFAYLVHDCVFPQLFE